MKKPVIPPRVGEVMVTPAGRRAEVLKIDSARGEATVRMLPAVASFRFANLRRQGEDGLVVLNGPDPEPDANPGGV